MNNRIIKFIEYEKLYENRINLKEDEIRKTLEDFRFIIEYLEKNPIKNITDLYSKNIYPRRKLQMMYEEGLIKKDENGYLKFRSRFPSNNLVTKYLKSTKLKSKEESESTKNSRLEKIKFLLETIYKKFKRRNMRSLSEEDIIDIINSSEDFDFKFLKNLLDENILEKTTEVINGVAYKVIKWVGSEPDEKMINSLYKHAYDKEKNSDIFNRKLNTETEDFEIRKLNKDLKKASEKI